MLRTAKITRLGDGRHIRGRARPNDYKPPAHAKVVEGGIDEAGRGAVLGPLVVAGIAFDDPDVASRMGCTDSKRLSPDRRRALDRALRASDGVRFIVRPIEAETLDEERRSGRTLNEIEVRRFQEIVGLLGAPTVYVDAADVDAARFGNAVGKGFAGRIVSEHKADLTYPVVGAASILAKVARDAAIEQLARRLERRLGLRVGSGYPSDPDTRAFLAGWHRAYGEWPEGTRTTWATLRDLTGAQASLDAFGANGRVAHKP